MAMSQTELPPQLPPKPGVWNHLRLVIVLALAVLVVAIIGAARIMSRDPQPTINQVDKTAPAQTGDAKQNIDDTKLNVN